MPVCNAEDKLAKPCTRCFAGFPRFCTSLVDAPCFECARGIPHQCQEKAREQKKAGERAAAVAKKKAEEETAAAKKKATEEATKEEQKKAEEKAAAADRKKAEEETAAAEKKANEEIKEKTAAIDESIAATEKKENEDVHMVPSHGLASGDFKHTVFSPLVAEYKKAAEEVIERAAVKVKSPDTKEKVCSGDENLSSKESSNDSKKTNDTTTGKNNNDSGNQIFSITKKSHMKSVQFALPNVNVLKD